ncbi:MAG: Tim44/TimA family putative adaptor protein [Vitreimonas sp.]
MDQSTIEIVVLAFIAGFVLFRLYATLGRRTGAERPVAPHPAPVQGPMPQGLTPSSPLPQAFAGNPASEGVIAIVRADPSFDIAHFMNGAKGAYEIIVGAFAKGDRDALRNLLTPRVFDSYIAAIAAREAKGEPGPELVRLKSADLAGAELAGDTARVTVKFESELAEGAHGVRDAHERWTFERLIRTSDPNWRLARVAAA